jgi:Cu/Ag efflux pump CusA
MIGGMISSTVLRLIVTPAVYGLIEGWVITAADIGTRSSRVFAPP